MTSGRKFILEVIVDTVKLVDLPDKDSILTSDVRLTIALSELAVVHIKPSPVIVQSPSLPDTVLFGGAGKLCEFSSTKSELSSATLSVLFLKEIPSINDHLILCMTPPLSFRELILSLPSCSPQPMVKRRFEFLDGRGSCEVYIRVSSETSEMKSENPRLTQSLHATSHQRPKNSHQSISARSETISAIANSVSSPKSFKSPKMTYGGLRKRASIIS
jgi:hypothetical protein